MEIKVKSYASQSSLLNSILFFILGAILFTSADKVLSFISIAFGIILAVTGIVEFVIFFVESKKEDVSPHKSHIAIGVSSIVIAIIFIFFSNIVEQFIRFIIGAWVLFTGIMRFINVLSISKKSKKFIPLLIVSLLLIAVGVYTIVKGDVILSTIGIIMMIYAVIEIIGYIFYTKDSQEPIEPGTTTLIVPEDDTPEETDSKEKNIKDVKENKKNKKNK